MILIGMIITCLPVNLFSESEPSISINRTHALQFYDSFLTSIKEQADSIMDLNNMVASLVSPPVLRQSPGRMYTIRLGKDLEYRDAELRKQELDRLGFFPVEIIPDDTGGHSLVVGRFPASDNAAQEIDNLLREGFFGGEVIRLDEAGLSSEEEELFMQIAPGQAETREVYRIFLGRFNNQNDAIDHKTMIEMEGYYPVEIIPENGQWNVYLGRYDSENLAQEVERSVHNEGFIAAQVVQTTEERAVSATRERLARVRDEEDIERQIERARQLGDDVLYVQNLERLLHSSLEQERVIEELRRAVQMLDSAQRERLLEERRREEQQRLMEANIRQLHRQAFRLLEQRQPRQAMTLWEDILEMDPNNSQAILYMQMAREQIRDLETREQRDAERQKTEAEINSLVSQGLDQLTANNLEEAERIFRRVLALDSENIEARQALQQITARTISDRGGFQFTDQLALFLFSLLLIIILGVFIFLFIRYRQISERDRKLLEQVQQLSYNPPINPSENDAIPGGGPQTPKIPPAPSKDEADISVEEPADIAIEETPAPAYESLSPSDKSMESERINLSEEVTSPSTKENEEDEDNEAESDTEQENGSTEGKDQAGDPDKIKASDKDSVKGPEQDDSESKTLDDFDEIFTISSDDEESSEELFEEEKESEDEADPLSFIEGEEAGTKEEEEEDDDEALADEKSEEQLSRFFHTTKKEAPDDDTEFKEEVTEKNQESPGIDNSDPKALFSQDFEEESVGKIPEGWEGGYDYASLQVVDDTECLSGKKCIYYQKDEPKGTAYFYREISPLKGTFSIEFDFRCDHKNKYLLGVYLEKDRDFRQSIHTILYMVNPADPKLRIHGESTPYELGNWKKIRYDVDLENQSLSGYVNGRMVMQNAKLPPSLDYINTISIRDNLGTTARMYLNNFKASRL